MCNLYFNVSSCGLLPITLLSWNFWQLEGNRLHGAVHVGKKNRYSIIIFYFTLKMAQSGAISEECNYVF